MVAQKSGRKTTHALYWCIKQGVACRSVDEEKKRGGKVFILFFFLGGTFSLQATKR